MFSLKLNINIFEFALKVLSRPLKTQFNGHSLYKNFLKRKVLNSTDFWIGDYYNNECVLNKLL